MSGTKLLRILTVFSLATIGSGCVLQPITEIRREFNIVDYDAPALRIGKPVKAELWQKNPETGKWEPIGEGTIPAGAYIKGRAPANKKIEDVLKEEED